ncbi:molybdenum cofactor guanylyltransferase [Synechococcus sp. CS-1324]|uniref:molybdenum cofactor guanylyltransferase n=1 Tax=Synechococcus sp. CS-1324 TaxID=2847980 RepID=UPI000DAFE5F6|nr:molybdenum cofactor guanylyltransferase [Synechococcus sp. CS-1324]MCT0230272.1 molybdenum cofactor guanylyltransferase [Synechococcus sp. CS-1324]PZV04227.1 MAG: molybdenum cofactor guanylyltransferase [Cyanobium sp.]
MASPPPLRPCLLSGGQSRRMGTDKALLAHPCGGTWLEHSLGLLGRFQQPVTLLSRHPQHGELALQCAEREGFRLEVLLEPPPWEGPLLALRRLMLHHRGQRLLLTPVDMPWLRLEALQELVEAADHDPARIQVAHDGQRLQPLVGIYPASLNHCDSLDDFTARGGRSLLRWLRQERSFRAVALDPLQLVNANTPADWPASRNQSG